VGVRSAPFGGTTFFTGLAGVGFLAAPAVLDVLADRGLVGATSLGGAFFFSGRALFVALPAFPARAGPAALDPGAGAASLSRGSSFATSTPP
jgi:hypothetical protein